MKYFGIYKYELFLVSQVSILLGSLFFTGRLFDDYISSALFYFNIIAATFIIYRFQNSFIWIVVAILPFILAFPIFFELPNNFNRAIQFCKLGLLIWIHLYLTIQLARQIFKSKSLNIKTLIAWMSGFISLGILGFLICMCIEISHPISFTGISTISSELGVLTNNLMFFSYSTLLTMGNCDIMPITQVAQKATILIGLSGHFYLVIFIALLLEKYIRQNKI